MNMAILRRVLKSASALVHLPDGGQDFWPTADECVDVCRNSLDMCTPGGKLQCTSLCRSLTREEYVCVLSDGASCDGVDACLPP